jgi:hypothetical protein
MKAPGGGRAQSDGMNHASYSVIQPTAPQNIEQLPALIDRAEMRMADEIDRGQANGELAPRHRQKEALASPTLSDLGVRRDQLHEWRQLRDVGVAAVEQVINDVLFEGRAPTKADIRGHFRTRGNGEYELYTPAEYVEVARRVLETIDLDPASCDRAQETVRAREYCTKERDGLAQEWHGRIWINPPFGEPLITRFIDKLMVELETRRTTEAILLVGAYTEFRWFQKAAARCAALCFSKKRMNFDRPEGDGPGRPNFGSAFLYFGRNPERFQNEFAPYGLIMFPAGAAP